MAKITNTRLKIAIACTFVVASVVLVGIQIANHQSAKVTPPAPIEKPIKKPEPAPEIKPEPVPAPPVVEEQAPAPAPQPAPAPRPPVFSGGMAGELLNGVNAIRANQGLPPVYESSQLNQSALMEANYLCANNIWDHGDFVSMMHSVGYYFSFAGENLAKEYPDANGALQAWVESPGHYQNMLDNWSDAGMAVITCGSYQGAENVLIMVSHFGRK